jgi:tetratricopeptide (TPR) repeat protein
MEKNLVHEEQNLVDEAVVQYRKALELKPDSAGTEYGLGNGLLGQGHVDEAVAHFSRALELQPTLTQAQANLAWIMATSPEDSLRHGQKAVELAQRANQSSGSSDPMILRILAAAYAEVGRFSDAAETAQRARQIAESQANSMLAARLRAQVELYQAGSPLRVPVLARRPAPHH